MPRMRTIASILSFAFCASATTRLTGQQIPLNPFSSGAPDSGGHVLISPLTQPTLTPGVLQLMELESRFAADVAKGGGKAFAAWFTDDAVVLNNGKPPVLGRSAIAQQAVWDPATYQLTWTPQGAQMGPSNDMGYTWGHYEGKAKDNNGQPIVLTGRYMTVWKKLPGGAWKVSLEASANEAPNAGDCCALPKP
ncbi:Ketosteroid isomerase homolog [Granulicella rosea]|uniref:Ketosteroid isomerase homolog n=1 Tax=Granulicella rosea TaxID=474952 RepID=A0A239IB20_9BACT|nr:nuclear transport factor 2 family protein [Granulicella rosea]SNS90263.1 Ketosteroid isomerase homolog [Granulicella rosea]